LKILFITRSTLYKVKGGDTIQVVNTAKYLTKLGVEIDIKLCDEKITYDKYDLIHFFNIIRPADILSHITDSGKPFVISPIFVDYSEFEKKERAGLFGFAAKILPADSLEYVKVIARYIFNGEKIVSPSYLLLGQKAAIKKILKKATMLLPNSKNEYNRLLKRYHVERPFKIIFNAVDTEIFNPSIEDGKRDSNLVLCVGRIEGIKNQLNLIKALNNTAFRLILIGSASMNHKQYYQQCREIAAPNVQFIENIPQEELIQYYCKAKVHVLPSWFETTGLSSLEAAAMGCNIVITDKGDTREYFGDWAHYCDPALTESIFTAVQTAAVSEFPRSLQTKIFSLYTWQEAASKTLQAYQETVGHTN